MADDNKNKKDDAASAQAKARAAALAKQASTPPSQVYRETITELKKTTWPDRETLTKSVYVVLAFIVATAAWVGLLDVFFQRVDTLLYGVK